MASLSQPPASLKPVSHYLKVALEHDNRDQVISYWARFAAVQKSLTIDKSSPEAKMFVIGLLDWLEKQKKALAGNEAITIEAAGEAHVENYALKLFNWADQSDRAAVFNKNVVKAFYTAGILFDILESLRPPLSDEFQSARKYSKWKAAYIHNCLKNGEQPIPGGGAEEEDEEDDESGLLQPPPAAPPSSHGGGAPSSSSGSFGFVDPKPSDSYYGDGSVSRDDGGGGFGYHQGGFGAPAAAPAAPQVPSSLGSGGGAYQQDAVMSGGVGASGSSGASLSVEQIAKAQKYCKWAGSALNFDDVSSAIENLEKALHLLKTGQEL